MPSTTSKGSTSGSGTPPPSLLMTEQMMWPGILSRDVGGVEEHAA